MLAADLLIGRFGAFKTSRTPVGTNRNGASSATMAGEALAYVQASRLKANAIACTRFLNSPVTSGFAISAAPLVTP